MTLSTDPWRCTILGQPPSVNSMYTRGEVINDKGRSYRGVVKTGEANRYQQDALLQVRSAKPSGWVGGTRVRIKYWFYLDRDQDCDNCLKALNDAIAHALNMDDKAFLPCVQEKVTGIEHPFVQIEVMNIL